MFSLYYLGGPWDLHKTMLAKMPQSRIRMPKRETTSWENDVGLGEITLVTHDYIVRHVAENVFVAIYEDDML